MSTNTKATSSTDIILEDFLDRDPDTYVSSRKDRRSGWELSLPAGTAYSSYFMSGTSPEDLIKNAYGHAKDMITAMDCPFKVNIMLSPTESKTDGKNIWVATKVFSHSTLTDGQKTDVFTGFAIHEGSHLLYTDFSRMKSTSKIVHHLWNVIEDERIERRLGQEKPGLVNFIKMTKYYVFDKYGMALDEIYEDKPLPTIVRLLNCILAMVRYPKIMERDEIEEFADTLLKVRDILTPFPDSTAASLAAAEDIYKAIRDRYIKEEEQKIRQDKQQQKDRSQPEQDSEQTEDPEEGQSGDSTDAQPESKEKAGNDGNNGQDPEDKQNTNTSGQEQPEGEDYSETEEDKSSGSEKTETEQGNVEDDIHDVDKSGCDQDGDDSENTDHDSEEDSNTGETEDESDNGEDDVHDGDKSDCDQDGDNSEDAGHESEEDSNTEEAEDASDNGEDDVHDGDKSGYDHDEDDSEEAGHDSEEDSNTGETEDVSDNGEDDVHDGDKSDCDQDGDDSEDTGHDSEKDSNTEEAKDVSDTEDYDGTEDTELTDEEKTDAAIEASRRMEKDMPGAEKLLSTLSDDPSEDMPNIDKDDICKEVLQDDYMLARECQGELERGSLPDSIIRRGENNEANYRTSLDKIRKHIPAMRKAIEINGTDTRFTLRGMRSGRLDTGKLAEAVQGCPTVYIRQAEVKAKKTAAVVLIDESGSMMGEPIIAARDTAVLINEALSGVQNLDLYIYGYSTSATHRELYVYKEKGFRNRYALGSLNNRYYTPTDTAIEECTARVRKMTQEETVLFIISDGMPDNGPQSVAEAVAKAEKRGFTTIGISINPALPESEMKAMYKHYITHHDISSLAPELGKVIKKTMLGKGKRTMTTI